MVVPGNCGESESDKTIEYSEELNYFYFPPSPPCFPPLPTTFPPSPPYFPPYSPNSSNSSKIYRGCAIFMREWVPNQQMEAWQAVELAFFSEYRIQGRGGVLDVMPGGKLMRINGLEQQHEDINRSKASKALALLVDCRDNGTGLGRHILSDLEYNDSVEAEDVRQYRIWYTGGEVHVIPSWGALTFKGSEVSDGQDLSTTPEPPLILQTKTSIRLWLGNHGDWGVEFRFKWNWLNIGTFKIESSALTNEWVFRCRGGKDHIDFPFPELSPNRNREEPTTARITEIPTLALPPTTQQENPDEDFGLGCSEVTGNGGVEAVGIGSWNCCDSTTIQVIQSTLLVDQEEIPLSNSDTLPSDQALATTVDTNSVLVKEIPPPLVLPTAQQEKYLDEDLGNDEVDDVGIGIGSEGTKEGEIAEAQFDSGAFGKRKRKEKTPRGGRGNKKTTLVRNYISLEKILQVKKMRLTEASQHLKVSSSALKRACRENGIRRWPPCDIHETPAVVNEEESTPFTSDTLLSDQALMATVDRNSVAEETTPQQFSPTVRKEKPDKDSSNGEVEEVGMGGVGTGEGEMRKNEKASGGERGGVRIKIPLEEILTYSHMCIEDAAMELKVSRSTLKRICRDYNISRWPPRDEHKRIGQSRPNKSLAIVDQERIPPLNSNTLLPANQVSATIDNTNSVIVRVNYQDIRIKFRLSLPWRMVELEQEVKKRLQFKAGTYYIKYKDEDDGFTLIACDEDLKDCISSSSSLGTHSIEVFLSQKVAHEVRVDKL